MSDLDTLRRAHGFSLRLAAHKTRQVTGYKKTLTDDEYMRIAKRILGRSRRVYKKLVSLRSIGEHPIK